MGYISTMCWDGILEGLPGIIRVYVEVTRCESETTDTRRLHAFALYRQQPQCLQFHASAGSYKVQLTLNDLMI